MSQDLISEYTQCSNEHWIINDFKTNISFGFTILTKASRSAHSHIFFFQFQNSHNKFVETTIIDIKIVRCAFEILYICTHPYIMHI